MTWRFFRPVLFIWTAIVVFLGITAAAAPATSFSLDDVLGGIALFVHTHLAVVSVASALVILGLFLGDVEDFVLYGLEHGWRALLSLNVIMAIIAGDAANSTAAGAAALAFLGSLGAGATYRDAGITALVAIGTVNTGFLLGADRAKLGQIFDALGKRNAAPAATAKT